MTSVIVLYHNEPEEFFSECIDQVRATIGLKDYELIIVDDHSDVPLEPVPGAVVLRNDENKGVGRSFDVGVSYAGGENLILMACDMRFTNNLWAEKLLEVVGKNPKSLVCTGCVSLTQDVEGGLDFLARSKVKVCYGADIIFFHDHRTNPQKTISFRGLFDAKWRAKEDKPVYEIPCILGACYGVKKSWYEHLNGFWGHVQWGSLEPYISLKSWMFGGNCLIAKDILTGHIFKKPGSPLNVAHGIRQESLFYNKMLIAHLLAENPELYIDFLKDNYITRKAKRMIRLNMAEITKERQRCMKKTVMSMDEFAKKFNVRQDVYSADRVILY